MDKTQPEHEREFETWVEEMLALSEEQKMTPKQIAILRSAVEVFAEKGFSAAATSEIAQKAGVAEGTIFRYYKTKKDLLLAIVAPTMSRMIAPFVLRNFGDVLETPYDTFEAFMRAFTLNRLEFARNNFKIIKILIQEIPFQPALKKQFLDNVLSQVLERVSSVVERFQQEGQIVDAPSPAVIRFAASSVIGYLLTRLLLLPEQEWDDEQEVSQMISFVMHGIGRNDAADHPAARKE